MEQNLRGVENDRQKQWSKWLLLTEWWSNSTYHSSIGMSPYEALYGVKPNIMNIPQPFETRVATFENFWLEGSNESYSQESNQRCITQV